MKYLMSHDLYSWYSISASPWQSKEVQGSDYYMLRSLRSAKVNQRTTNITNIVTQIPFLTMKKNEIRRNFTRLKIDFLYFPEREHTEHWQWIVIVFFENAFNILTRVYGTSGRAIIVNTKIGNNAVFSSDAAILTFLLLKKKT